MTSRPGASLAVAALAVAAFGPYLPLPGVRTEQATVYGSCLAGVVLCAWMRARPTTAGALVVALLLVQVGVAAAGALEPIANGTGHGLGSLAGGFDNLLLPPALLAVVWMVLGRTGCPQRLVRVVAGCVIVGVCANTVLAVASINYDVGWLLGRFWGNGGEEAVADRAMQMGRYTGIFNQPAEAGQMYSMALLAAVWLLRNRPALLAATAATVTVGGIVAASKVFLLVGLPVGAWQMLRLATGRQRHLVAVGCVVAAVFGAVQLGVGTDWTGGQMIAGLLHPAGDAGAAGYYTAGRLGDESTLRAGFEVIAAVSPWFGFGAAGLAIPYDSGWLESFATAGLVGIVVYTMMLVVLAVTWWRRRLLVDKAWSQFSGGLVLVLVGASMGLPALTANRVATVSWLLVTLLLLCSTPNDPNVLKRTATTRRTARSRLT